MRPHQWYSTWAILAAVAAPLGAQARVLTRLEERGFGRMPDGTGVTSFTLRNDRGMEIRVAKPSNADFQMGFARGIKFIPSTQMKKGILSKE